MAGFYGTFSSYLKAVCNMKGLHFYKRNWEEFFGDLSGVEFPCLLLDRHDFSYMDNKSDNVQKKRTVAFIVCDYVEDKTDDAAFNDALDTAEQGVDRVLNQMKQDVRAPFTGSLRYFDFNEVEATAIENEAVGAWGYYVTCEVSVKHDNF